MTISNTVAAKSSVQEATETPAQTKAEAAKGDQQAVRKLTSQQAVNQNQTAPQPNEIVDSNRGRLNTKA